MSAIDWDREFEEPWRSIGKDFCRKVYPRIAPRPGHPSLADDRKAIKASPLTKEQIAERAGVSTKFIEMFYAGDVPAKSPFAKRVREILANVPK